MVEVVRPQDQQPRQHHMERKKSSHTILRFGIQRSDRATMVGKESEARKETNKLGENEWVIGLEILMRLIICIG